MTNIRNPFPPIGKVIKYEFLHSSKKILPLYGVLLVLGFICGITANPEAMKIETNNMSMNFSIDNTTSAASALSSTVYFALIIASIVVTIVVLENRFKKSMLGEEAYLNLSLPVTIGEHLWGRIIATVLFDLICAVLLVLSFMLCFSAIISQSGGMKYVGEAYATMIENFNTEGFHCNKVTFVLDILIIFLSANLLIVSFTFLIDSLAQLFKTNKGLFQFICAIALLFVTARICKLLPSIDSIWGACLVMIGISAVYFTGIYFIFAKNLNLE